ncbi:MAG: hypothetical protein ACK5QC_02955 [Bacteroidota bacterium]
MRPVDGHKNNGLTRTAFSCLRHRQFKTSTDTETVFSFFLPTARFGFDKPVLAIANLAHLSLPCRQATTQAKPKKLNSPTHFFGFFKPSFAITNLTQFVFARDRQKQNQLNFPTHKIGLLRSLFTRALDVPQSAPHACGIIFLSVTKSCMTSFSKNILGFP